MIQMGSRMICADNTGVKELGCVKVLGGSKRRTASVGDTIVCSVKKVIPTSKFKKGAVVKAIIVRQSFKISRKDGSVLRFDNNAAIILSADSISGTRIFGPVAREVCRSEKDAIGTKILSLAPEVL